MKQPFLKHKRSGGFPMMDHKENWELFSKTGHISDYLSYIACTREDTTEYNSSSKEGENGGEFYHTDRDGFDRHAGW